MAPRRVGAMPTPTRWAVVLVAATIAWARYGGLAAAFSAAPGRIALRAATLPAGAASRHLEPPRTPLQGPSDAAAGWRPCAAAAVALAAFALVGSATRPMPTSKSKQGAGAQLVLAHALELPTLAARSGAAAAASTARGSRIVAGVKQNRKLKQGFVRDFNPLRFKPAEFRSREVNPYRSSPAPGNDQGTVNSRKWHYVDKKYGINMFHLHRTKMQNSQPRKTKGDFSMLRRWTKWLRYTQHLGKNDRCRNVHKHARQAASNILRSRTRRAMFLKRDMRWIWRKRIDNQLKLHGLMYNEFHSNLKIQKIHLNKKMLQQLAVYDRGLFTNLVDITIPDWPVRKEFFAKGGYGHQQLEPAQVEDQHKKNENLVIDYIEKMMPRVYTDDTIRFNRKAFNWGTQFTVDCGDKEYWQEVLPRYPELANFQVADYWTQRPNQQNPILTADVLPSIVKYDPPQWPNDPREAPVKGSLPIQEGEEVKDEKPDISRESWFDEEPQSWFD